MTHSTKNEELPAIGIEEEEIIAVSHKAGECCNSRLSTFYIACGRSEE